VKSLEPVTHVQKQFLGYFVVITHFFGMLNVLFGVCDDIQDNFHLFVKLSITCAKNALKLIILSDKI